MFVFNGFFFRLMSFLASLSLLSSCAFTQWAFRNANDREVVVRSSAKQIKDVVITKRYIVIHIGEGLCVDILRMNKNVKKLDIFIDDAQYDCPTGVEKEMREEQNLNKKLTLIYDKMESQYKSPIDLEIQLRHSLGKKEFIEGNKFYYALVPLTFIIDFVTSPIQFGIYFYQIRKQNLEKKGR